MRIIFLGTPQFAVPSLNALCDKHEVVAVVCQPDREKDRKGRTIDGAVKRAAQEKGIPVYQFERIKTEGTEVLRSLRPDVMVTCAYGQILSKEILDIAPFGVINVHGSLLPALRGAAPIQRALMNGDRKTGVTIMRTDVGMDSGDILIAKELLINDDDYVQDLFEKLSLLGAETLVGVIDDYVSGRIVPVRQDESAATYAPMIKKEEANLDFSKSASKLRNTIRGIGYGICAFGGLSVKIYKANAVSYAGAYKNGEVAEVGKNKLVVACGDGALEILELQMSGKKRLHIADFLNGVRVSVGDKFE